MLIREIKTYFKGAPFYNAFIRTWKRPAQNKSAALVAFLQHGAGQVRDASVGNLPLFVGMRHADPNDACQLVIAGSRMAYPKFRTVLISLTS